MRNLNKVQNLGLIWNENMFFLYLYSLNCLDTWHHFCRFRCVRDTAIYIIHNEFITHADLTTTNRIIDMYTSIPTYIDSPHIPYKSTQLTYTYSHINKCNFRSAKHIIKNIAACVSAEESSPRGHRHIVFGSHTEGHHLYSYTQMYGSADPAQCKNKRYRCNRQCKAYSLIR